MPVTVLQFDVGCRKRKRRPHDKAPVGEIITLDGHRLPRLYRRDDGSIIFIDENDAAYGVGSDSACIQGPPIILVKISSGGVGGRQPPTSLSAAQSWNVKQSAGRPAPIFGVSRFHATRVLAARAKGSRPLAVVAR